MEVSMKKYIGLLLGVLVGFLCLGLADPIAAVTLPDRPAGTSLVDEAAVLTSETIQQINSYNETWSQTEEQVQVAVYLTDSLPMDLESFSNQLFRHWQIGYSGTDKGVLLVIALEDRAFRIETSDQAATQLTDVEAKRILENSREFFRAGDYNSGVLYIVEAIGDRFYGTSLGQNKLSQFHQEEEGAEEEESIFPFVYGLVVLVVLLSLLSKGRKGPGSGGGSGGSDTLLWLLLHSAADHHWSSSDTDHSSWSGGSDWSGGGGGGGGASSGW